MISGSKSGYRRAYPDHVAVFNACIGDAHGAELWWGDLDLTLDEPKLVALAADLQMTLYGLYESDARSIGRERPIRLDVAPAVVQVSPDGETIVGTHRRLAKMARNAAGQLVWARDE